MEQDQHFEEIKNKMNQIISGLPKLRKGEATRPVCSGSLDETTNHSMAEKADPFNIGFVN